MATMWRTAGFATALVGLTLTMAARGFRKSSFIIVNGYMTKTWLIWAIVGVLVMTIGVVIFWRAA